MDISMTPEELEGRRAQFVRHVEKTTGVRAAMVHPIAPRASYVPKPPPSITPAAMSTSTPPTKGKISAAVKPFKPQVASIDSAYLVESTTEVSEAKTVATKIDTASNSDNSESESYGDVVKALTTLREEVAKLRGDSLKALATLLEGTLALTARVQGLESDNVEKAYQIEQLIKANEMPRILGSDTAQNPFVIYVTYHELVLAIQVCTAMKIEDLIRRCRSEAKLAPSKSKKLRILIDGEGVGSSTTLGEVGVTPFGKKDIALSYEMS